jgi:arylsulfatase A-like enzyme/tetratricopeptide (TPR) repeat protein
MKRLGPLVLIVAGCGGTAPAPPPPVAPPAILLVTLDTTRADHVAPEAPAEDTPNLAALAARGVSFAQAYTPVPLTLPAHASMMTGLYPGGHGIHENGRRVPADQRLLAAVLAGAGFHTAAVVSGAPLDSSYGLARGFATYDDDFGPGGNERKAAATTDRALEVLAGLGEPAFLWVHYFDPHEPYWPPKRFLARFPEDPYRAEIAYLDHELGRLLAAFEARYPDSRVLVVGDHGEGRGDHGEEFHGNLLYQATLRVPLVIAEQRPASGPASPLRIDQPVSTRAVFDTVLGWARGEAAPGLLATPPDLVLGEAMKPYLDYGWQPQVMAVRRARKAIQTGTVETELYDVQADPGETRDLAATTPLDREVRQALREYPVPITGGGPRGAPKGSAAVLEPTSGGLRSSPSPSAPPVATTDPAELDRLASLGYLVSSGPPTLRPDAPVPRRMTALFPDLALASGLFSAGRFAESIPAFERILRADPGNVSSALRLAAAHSSLGHDGPARAAFERARRLDPDSLDLRQYLGLHLKRFGAFDDAARELTAVLAATPDRVPALAALAEIRAHQGRGDEAEELYRRLLELDPDHVEALVARGLGAMGRGDTGGALAALERARELAPDRFEHHLELGVLYLAAQRLAEARDSLDRVPANHPGYPMALFKRAQVAVLLAEPDAAERIRRARAGADEGTRGLVEREALFRR